MITFAVCAISIRPSLSQTRSLGNTYQSSYDLSTNDHSTELKILRKDISEESSKNTNKLEKNLQELKARGYSFRMTDDISNSNIKTLLAIDDRLIAVQADLDFKIRNLKNYEFIDTARNYLTNFHSGSINLDEYRFLDIHSGFITRLSKLRAEYSKSTQPGSNETNNWYLQQVLAFNKTDDQEKFKILEHSLAEQKKISDQNLLAIAKRKQEIEEEKNRQDAESLAERTQIRIKNEKAEELQTKRETEIASLPSKAAISAKFRTYKHKNGYVFEMFPAGFVPKPNKASYDKIRYFGKTYTSSYREHNDYGINSLVIEFQYSGKISNVTVFNGSDVIYLAEYREGSNKPYQIITKSADKKFQLRVQRSYNVMTNKMDQIISYTYLPLDYNYDDGY